MIKQALKYLLALILLVPLIIWAALALKIDSGASPLIATFISIGFILFALALLWRTRASFRGVLLVLGMFLLVLVWWRQIKPSNTRNWALDVTQLPRAEIQGDKITIHNVRNFAYTSESQFTPHWESRTYDINDIRGLDLFLSYWGSPWIAHTIVSWEFGDGQHLAISIETRKEQGEEYSALLGFFRQYELYYVVADEHDIVRLRTNFRHEDVYLYRIREEPQFARALLLDYLEEVNRLAVEPKWYNAFTDNCTTTIRQHRQHVGRAQTWDWRMLVNGYIDELGHANGTIDNSLPFAEIKQRSLINKRAQAIDGDAFFSSRIREHSNQQDGVVK